MPISSPTDIANLALGHLGEQRITSLDADNAAARACNLHYESVRDEVFRSHRWNFAQERVTLSALADAPLFGWSYQYQLPTDCLRVLEVNDSEFGDVLSDEYVIEAGKLLTDATTVNMVYIRRIEDVSRFDPLFVQALAIKLAVVLSETIRGTTGKTEALLQAYERVTAPLARRIDANEGRRRKGLMSINSFWLRERGAIWGVPTTGTSGGTSTSTTAALYFSTVAVSGQTSAEATIASDTLTLVAGSNITITTSGKSVTINASASGTGTVTSVAGAGSVSGLTLTGTVTSSGALTLGGTLDLSAPPAIGGTTPAAGTFTTLRATSLPTSDPAVAGSLWNNGGFLMVSAG